MSLSTEARREDILVSICLSDMPPTPAALANVAEFASLLDARFRFREIVLVTKASEQKAFLPLVKAIPNVRLFVVREGLSPYHERVVAASEAIGDVVLLAGPEQFGTLDHIAMIEAAASEGRIIVGLRDGPRGLRRVLTLMLTAAGRAAGFLAGLQNGPTIAVPRTLLNPLLEHSDPDLALRFIPRDPAFPVATFAPKPGKSLPAETRSITRRLGLIAKLVLHMAPNALLIVTLASGLLTCLGVAYAVYVVGVCVFLPVIEPGWLTISTMLSLTAIFLGTSIFGLSIGVQRILSLLRHDTSDSVAQEVNRTDLFGQVAFELNVDLDRSHG